MITLNTVLITGAGASIPYGFPSGEKLFHNICNNLKEGSNRSTQIVNLLRCPPQHVRDFRDSLFSSGRKSVDQFLEHRTGFIDVGKYAIAQELIKYEQHNKIYELRSEENWLTYVFGIMNSTFDDFHNNKISFVTFNYDRTIEHFLFTSLKNSYGRTDKEVAENLENIPIIHLHGQLGYLPWQEQEWSRSYEPNKDDHILRIASKNIKIIHESVDEDDDFQKAHDLITKADRIFFLGFGFHPTNLTRLKLQELGQNKQIGGTAINITVPEKDKISKEVRWIKPSNLRNVDIVTLFRTFFSIG